MCKMQRDIPSFFYFILFYYFVCFFLIGVRLIYNVVLVSGVQLSDSDIYIYIYFRYIHISDYIPL